MKDTLIFSTSNKLLDIYGSCPFQKFPLSRLNQMFPAKTMVALHWVIANIVAFPREVRTLVNKTISLYVSSTEHSFCKLSSFAQNIDRAWIVFFVFRSRLNQFLIKRLLDIRSIWALDDLFTFSLFWFDRDLFWDLLLKKLYSSLGVCSLNLFFQKNFLVWVDPILDELS